MQKLLSLRVVLLVMGRSQRRFLAVRNATPMSRSSRISSWDRGGLSRLKRAVGAEKFRAMDNGLMQQQAGQVATHLNFYSDWLNAFPALSVVKVVFKRPLR
jgi:hypothetical protein